MVAAESEGVSEGKEWPPTGVEVDSSKGLCRCATQGTRVQVRRRKGRSKKMGVFGLKQDNVRMFGATSRRSREEIFQRRDVVIQRCDVPENGKNQHRDVGYQRRDVPEGFKINVAMLGSHIATFQRSSKSTSQHWDLTLRHSRGVQNERRDVGISRRDVPEEGQTDVATLRRRDVTGKAQNVH